jgi:hypothetical protein
MTKIKKHYDIHLSSSAISTETITKLGALGMSRDELQNNRNSVEPHYHGSMPHMDIPNESLWVLLKETLVADPTFRGALEFEINDSDFVYHFNTSKNLIPDLANPFKLEECIPGEHKACDVHIRVDPINSSLEAIAELENFNFIYFERKVKGICYPVYTLTFENATIAEAVAKRLVASLEKIPNLVAKMKIEKIYDHWVYPEDATQLPIVRTNDAEGWLRQMN